MVENNNSRINKYDKRRKTTKSITLLVIIAGLLLLLLISMFIFGGKNEENTDEKSQTSETNEEDSTENSDESSSKDHIDGENEDEEKDADVDDGSKDENDSDDHVEIEEIPAEDIDDSNIIEAYTANWKPVGTSQEEPHEISYDEGSADWKEMMEAIGYALKLEVDEFTTHWIGNGGDQRVDGYVQSHISDEHYTVYLQWEESEGWLPIKVERVEQFIHPKQ